MAVTFQELRIPDSSFEISLVKLITKPIKDIRGYLTTEFGDPVFKMTKVEFEDGTFLGCEGEHDLPYLVRWGQTDQPNYDDKSLLRITKQDPDYTDDK